MEIGHESMSHVIFGWDPLWVSTILFVVTYAVIVTERIAQSSQVLAPG